MYTCMESEFEWNSKNDIAGNSEAKRPKCQAKKKFPLLYRQTLSFIPCHPILHQKQRFLRTTQIQILHFHYNNFFLSSLWDLLNLCVFLFAFSFAKSQPSLCTPSLSVSIYTSLSVRIGWHSGLAVVSLGTWFRVQEKQKVRWVLIFNSVGYVFVW